MPIAVLIFCLAYATLRYIVFGDVALEQWPVLIVNKSVSFFIAACMAASAFYSLKLKKEPQDQQSANGSARYGRWAWHALILHILLSIALLNPAYFAKFYEEQKLNLLGNLMLLAGALGSYAFYRLQTERLNNLIKALASLALFAHLLPMSSSWASPDQWPAYFPPISMLSALLAAYAMLGFGRCAIFCQSQNS
ncbi:hypothetical protein [Pseudoteredinibacter isoporae]|uniref:hypothetical protein n=1 Tax=Pseudoteredinibacter isoporae TaxID=570281 RepID=UPI0031077618